MQVDWLNKFILNMWPYLDKVIPYLINFQSFQNLNTELQAVSMYRQFVKQLKAQHSLYLTNTLGSIRLKQLNLRSLGPI